MSTGQRTIEEPPNLRQYVCAYKALSNPRIVEMTAELAAHFDRYGEGLDELDTRLAYLLDHELGYLRT